MTYPVVMSYTVCHYGRDFLQYALRAISPVVNKSYVFYTSTPSHGHSTELVNPETRDEIMSSIPLDLWKNLVWVDTKDFTHEGPQRDYAVDVLTTEGADVILNVDYDEIWDTALLDLAIKEVWDRNISRNWLVNMLHFWKSFSWVSEDDGWPVRVIDTRRRTGISYLGPNDFGKVYHFGYCIKDDLMKYKMSLHGHKNEWRHNWFNEKWSVWPPAQDVHPTNTFKQNGEGWWDPKPFDKNKLPEVMHSHPYWNVEPIK